MESEWPSMSRARCIGAKWVLLRKVRRPRTVGRLPKVHRLVRFLSVCTPVCTGALLVRVALLAAVALLSSNAAWRSTAAGQCSLPTSLLRLANAASLPPGRLHCDGDARGRGREAAPTEPCPVSFSHSLMRHCCGMCLSLMRVKFGGACG